MSMKLKPRIEEVEFGIRNPRTIKIYPLSISDQIKVADLVGNGIKKFFDEKKLEETNDLELFSFVLSFAQENLPELLSCITDINDREKDISEILKEMTNDALAEIVKIVLEVNFLNPIKKVQGLLRTPEIESSLRRPVPISSGVTRPTDSNILTGDHTGTEG